MTARPVQISVDEELLGRIDADPEVQAMGRSAFIRSAVLLYLRARERRATDQAILKAYSGKAEAMLDEITAMIEAQAWPDD